MKVVDASVVVDAFSSTGRRGLAATYALESSPLAAPQHMDLEAISGWRKQVRLNAMSSMDAVLAIDGLRRLRVKRLDHTPLYWRMWELRDNLSIQDAAYVALAELLGAPLITSDVRLTNAPGTKCEFELIS